MRGQQRGMASAEIQNLRVGVVGAGVFAGYHANKVADHPRATLTGIHDQSAEAAARASQRLSCEAFGTAEALFTASDAVIIATPATTHADLAIGALQAGCHVLIEKPIATTRDGAAAILAARGDRVLQVGHQERVVADACGLLDIPERPLEVRIRRHTGRATRNLDTSVVMDLMIHDLDLVGAMFGAPDWVSTEAAAARYSDHLDMARAELGYPGFTTYLSASRDAQAERSWQLRYPSGTVHIDFAAKRLQHDTPFALNPDFGDMPAVTDSLAAAFDRFVAACLDGAEPLASGEDGLAALELALRIEGDAP